MSHHPTATGFGLGKPRRRWDYRKCSSAFASTATAATIPIMVITTGHGLGAGVNQLNGRLGNDTLVGKAGNDFFLFNTAPNTITNRDTITDFNVAQDTIRLDNAVFTALGTATGVLAVNKFLLGAAAHDADDRIIYNPATGALIYDPNGIAAGGAVQFATLAKNLAITNLDFLVV